MTRHRYVAIGATRVGRGNFGIVDLPEPEPWMYEGLCGQVDPEAWYPEKGGSTRDAKRICEGCPVRSECLEYALKHDERWGVWGALSERERRLLKPVKSPEALARIAAVQHLTAEGWPVRAIAAELGLSYSTVYTDTKRPLLEEAS